MSEWVPVTERLPKMHEWVLTWSPTHKEWPIIQRRMFDDEIDDWNWFLALESGCGGVGNITHWMALPSKPEN